MKSYSFCYHCSGRKKNAKVQTSTFRSGYSHFGDELILSGCLQPTLPLVCSRVEDRSQSSKIGPLDPCFVAQPGRAVSESNTSETVKNTGTASLRWLHTAAWLLWMSATFSLPCLQTPGCRGSNNSLLPSLLKNENKNQQLPLRSFTN